MQPRTGASEPNSLPSIEEFPAYRGVEERLEQTLGGWDRHVASCPECLSYGVHLCAVGESLAFDVERARSKRDKLAAQITRTRPHPKSVFPELPVTRLVSPAPSPVAGGTP